jgi:hypothetical protein
MAGLVAMAFVAASGPGAAWANGGPVEWTRATVVGDLVPAGYWKRPAQALSIEIDA